MSCLTLEPRLCLEHPSWWTRHIDFHTSCLFSSFVKTHFRNVLSNLFIFNQNCRTVLSSWGVPCQKCRTVVFFCRSIPAAWPRPQNPVFVAWLRSLPFLLHSNYQTGHFWLLELPGPFWALEGPRILVFGACLQSAAFLLHSL